MKIRFTIFFVLMTLLSTNLFCQWETRINGLPDWTTGLAIDACDSTTAVMSIYNRDVTKNIFLTTDAGNNWQNLIWPAASAESAANDIEIIDKNHIWAALDDGRIIATSDGGINWQVQFSDTTKTMFMNYIEMFDYNNGIAMGDCYSKDYQPDPNSPALFLKTTDGGTTWVQTTKQQLLGLWSGDMWRRMDFVSPDTGFYYASGNATLRLNYTESGGINWNSYSFDNTIYVMKFYDNKFGLIAGANSNGNGFYKTLNGGLSWEFFPADFEGWGNDIEFLPGDPSKVFFTDNKMLYFSADSGKTWELNSEIGGRDIVFTDKNHGWMLADNGKVYYTESSGRKITGVTTQSSNLPDGFELYQNYPNPFNPTTTIKYSIPNVETQHAASQHVTLKIYDMLGGEIAILVNGEKSPGNYEVKFNASNLSSGIYYFRMNAGNYSESKKMILMK